jgi:hypothetical protein
MVETSISPIEFEIIFPSSHHFVSNPFSINDFTDSSSLALLTTTVFDIHFHGHSFLSSFPNGFNIEAVFHYRDFVNFDFKLPHYPWLLHMGYPTLDYKSLFSCLFLSELYFYQLLNIEGSSYYSSILPSYVLSWFHNSTNYT